MARRIVQWWTAYFLGGIAIVLICFSLGAILYAVALTANGLHLTDQGVTTATALVWVGTPLVVICVLFATYELFLSNSENGLRGIPPFSLKSAIKWWVGGLICSTNPSNVLNDFVGFRRK